jgi:hypothetical protein
MLILRSIYQVKISLSLVFCFIFSISSSQTLGDFANSKETIDCNDVIYNAPLIVNDLIDKNQILKVYDFLDYWESNCGEIEQIYRLRTILDIERRSFNISSIDEATLDNLIVYKSLYNKVKDSINSGVELDRDYYNNFDAYFNITQELAKNTISNNIDEQLLLDFYADDNPSFDNIKKAPKTSRLRQVYDDFYGIFFNSPIDFLEFRYLFITGGIDNMDKLSIFGTRPSVGFGLGLQMKRHILDAILDVRIGPADQEYSTVYNGELLITNNYTSFYAGAEYTYNFYSNRRFHIGISGGLGYERITAYSPNDDELEEEEDSKNLPSFNRNIGLVMEHEYGRKGFFFGIQLRYHWADYNNSGGTTLDGNYLNLRLIWGKKENPTRDVYEDLLNGNLN